MCLHRLSSSTPSPTQLLCFPKYISDGVTTSPRPSPRLSAACWKESRLRADPNQSQVSSLDSCSSPTDLLPVPLQDVGNVPAGPRALHNYSGQSCCLRALSSLATCQVASLPSVICPKATSSGKRKPTWMCDLSHSSSPSKTAGLPCDISVICLAPQLPSDLPKPCLLSLLTRNSLRVGILRHPFL